jgi:3-hydroxyacyl-CoA dehydrogenase
MSTPSFLVRKAAVLGAGVMGAQIAAHLVNAGVPVVLFDLAGKEGDPDSIVKKALSGLAKLEPSPLATADRATYIDVANYDRDLALLAGCDLVIEAIAERMDWKRDLYAKIGPHLAPQAIFASNTSGLSINALADALPAAVRSRFCGIHFFNPPRYMHLVELIAQKSTDPALMDQLETFVVTTLGKGVVRAKDTPNFVANRVGIFSVLATMAHTEKFGLGFDVVDALTGPAIGRAKSATYRTADVVGLDTMAHVIKTMHDTLPDDPWHPFFSAPPVLAGLIAQGALGQKTRAGFFRKVGKDILVLDPAGARLPYAGVVDPRWRKSSRSRIRERNSPSCGRTRIRRRNSSGQSSATSFITPLFTWPPSRTARDVDLALCWASVGRWSVRALAGGRLEGRGRVARRRTSRPAKRLRKRLFLHG